MFLRKLFCCRPEPTFLSPRAKRGVSPWGHHLERREEGRRPERSEGCLAIARQDKKGARQDEVKETF